MRICLAARLLATTALVSVAGLPMAITAGAQELIVPAPPGPHTKGIAGGVSDDGNTVVGSLSITDLIRQRGFIWTADGGMAPLGGVSDLTGLLYNRFNALDISNDGTVVVGNAITYLFDGDEVVLTEIGGHASSGGYRWTAAGGFELLPQPANVLGVSGDGNVVVGSSKPGLVHQPFRWTVGEEELVVLDALPNQKNGEAWAASFDGSVIAGFVEMPNPDIPLATHPNAVRWTGTAVEALAMLNGGTQSWAFDISDSGKVIVGDALDGPYGMVRPVRWDEGAISTLVNFHPSYASHALGVSGDGLVVVGYGDDADISKPRHALRWASSSEVQTIEQWLLSSDPTLTFGTANPTTYARATNCDGSVVVGELYDGQIFVARGGGSGSDYCADLPDTDGGEPPGEEPPGEETPGGSEPPPPPPPPGGDAGYIGLDDLGDSLASAAQANAAVVDSLGLLLNGAGSRPLDRRVEEGKLLMWTGGDLGRDDHGISDGTVGLGEIGIGYNVGGLQFNGAIGLSGGHYDTLLGGTTDLSSAFVKLEAMSELYPTDVGGIWGVITGTALLGTADIRRNYLDNGGLIDSSFGQAGLAGFGARGRLQWENALPHVSPYGELAYTNACMGAYAETGGSFAASFNRLCGDALDIRVGVDVTVPIAEDLRIVGTLEGVHRLAGNNGSVTGDVIGLGAFDLGAAPTQQTWLRAGLGLEADLGATTFSVMGNLATQGETPSMWIAAQLRSVF